MPSFTAPTASDTCSGATLQNLGDTTSGNSCALVTTRSWRAVDACGNASATVRQSSTRVDTTGPTIGSAGSDATFECGTTMPAFTAPTASDTCNGATVQNLCDTTSGNSCALVTTRSWKAVDACGNTSATVSQHITRVDTTAPTIGSAGSDATFECGTTMPAFTAPTASDTCNGATVNQVGSDSTSGNSCALVTTRSWRAVDACGNTSATVSQHITRVDTTGPTIGSAGSRSEERCGGTVPAFTAPTASDTCNGATVQNLGDSTSGNSCAQIGRGSCREVDACGNTSATVSQHITRVDTTGPTIGSAGSDATFECGTTMPAFTAPTASDTCNGATVQNLGDSTSGNSCALVTTRSWKAVDACGNTSATVSQHITRVDTTGPTIGSAGSRSEERCGGTVPAFTAPTASDTCNGATVQNLGDSTSGNSCAQIGRGSCREVDACGNTSATVSQHITRVDTTGPTIGSAGSDATFECGTTMPAFTPPTASDTCSGATVNQVGSDSTSGNSCALVTTRSWNAVDACGNTSATVSQRITRVDTTAPTIGSPGAANTVECPATATFTAPTASDNCNGATVQDLGDTTSGNSCALVHTKSWRAVDACGNTSATVTQTSTLRDTSGPTIGSAGANNTVECPASPTFTAPTASDNCNGATV